MASLLDIEADDDDDIESLPETEVARSPLSAVASASGTYPRYQGKLFDLGSEMLKKGQTDSAGYIQKLEEATANLQRKLQPPADQVNLPLLAAASALIAPNKTGRFTESLSNAGNAAIGPLTQQRQTDLQREVLSSNATINLARARQAEFLKQQDLGVRLMTSGSRQPLERLSAIEQQLRAEGLKPGQPDYIQRAKELQTQILDVKRKAAPASKPQSAYAKAASDYTEGLLGGAPGSPESLAGWKAAMMALGFPESELPAAPAIRQPTAATAVPGAGSSATPGVPLSPTSPGVVTKPTDPTLVFGIPAIETDPWAGLGMKEKQQALKAARADYMKLRDAWGPQDATASQLTSQVDRFLDLHKKHQPSMVERAPLVGGAASGVAGIFSPAIREMEGISANMARHERQPGEGAVSDFDAKQFIKSTLSYDKPFEANQAIGTFKKAAAQAETDKREFQRKYFEVHKVLDGSDAAWKEYANANPILDKSGTDLDKNKIKLNDKRMSWQQYFRAKAAKAELARREEAGQ